MIRLALAAGLAAHAVCSLPAQEARFPELELLAALPVDGSAGLDLSGLAWKGGRLYAVADKDDAAIHRIRWDSGLTRAWIEKAVPVRLPPGSDKGRCDWEGLAVAPDGSWLLASESRHRVLAVPARGGTGRWITPDLRTAAAASGLLQQENAGLEGIAVRPDGTLLLAAERQPRGLILLTPQGAPRFFRLTTTLSLPSPPRFPDLADLLVDRGRVFGISRNTELLVELGQENGAWREIRGWSFRHTVYRADLRYLAGTFGMVEGLAFSPSRIYLCADNNRSGRAGARDDRRGLLYIFKRPDGL